jgi:hypothetical protein
MQQCAVRVTEGMPIDSLQTISLARGSKCLFLRLSAASGRPWLLENTNAS